MTKIVNVRFRDAGKIYRYTCDGMNLTIGDAVMVDSSLGEDLAHVTQEPYEFSGEINPEEVFPVLRLASTAEKERYLIKCDKEQEAYVKCQALIQKHELNMNLIDAVFSFDGKKVIFFFTSDNRVDFRELVKDLASVFRARIELRQIGSRDQAKLVGGIGVCGRELCCCTFLNHFAPVTLKLAREQGLSLNPTKLNGSCGRLMCCLQFEHEAYQDAQRRLPQVGKKVRTPRGMGVVNDVNLLEENVTVKFVVDDTTEFEKFEWEGLAPLNPEIGKRKDGDDNKSKGGHNCSDCNNDSSCPSKSDYHPGPRRDDDFAGNSDFFQD